MKNLLNPKQIKTYYILINIAMAVLFFYTLFMYFSLEKSGLSSFQLLRIGMSFCSMLGCAIFCWVIYAEERREEKSNTILQFLFFLTYLELTGYILFSLWRGKAQWYSIGYFSGIVAYMITPILCYTYWFYQNYLFPQVAAEKSLWKKIMLYGMIIDEIYVLAGILSNFVLYVDEEFQYIRGVGYPFILVYPVFVLGYCLIVNLQKEMPRKKKIALISFCLGPILTTFLTLYTREDIIYVAVFLSLMVIYGNVQTEKNQLLLKQEKELAEKNQALREQETRLLISQINPHFLYNTLSTIQSLCTTNPELAADVTENFAGFLRKNLDTLMDSKLVSMEKELEHLKNYTAIEKVRFPHIQVIYEIGTTDFEVPNLTVQPLVENAIRHGIRGKRDGKVIISTYEKENDFYIQITDNGVGFDQNRIYVDGKSHIGIENVQKRLEKMVNGTMKITSTLGMGTTVVIQVPGK